MHLHSLSEDTLAIVLAGGKGTRLGALTRQYCKPALPFGAAYRNIDFTLSNCVNSGVRRIAIATQYRPESLLRHIDEVWRDATCGSAELIATWPAQTCAPAGGYRGTADAVFRNLESIRRLRPQRVLVLAGDHVYRMDYRRMLELHCERRAEVTVGCVAVPPDQASEFGIVSANGEGRIERFIEKPQRSDQLPRSGPVLASMGIYVFEAAFLEAVLCRDAFSGGSGHDFGRDILPRLALESRMYGCPFSDSSSTNGAYWRDVGTPAAYWRANLELLDDRPRLRLDDPDWPMPAPRGAPAFTGEAPRSLIAGGCKISGRVARSVLFSDVAVAQGTQIENSVILPGASIGRHCRLNGVIVDSGCEVPDGFHIDAFRDSGAANGAPAPVVVTQEDLTPELACSNG